MGLGEISHMEKPSSFPPTKTFSDHYYLSAAWSFSVSSDPSPTRIATPSEMHPFGEFGEYNRQQSGQATHL